MKEMNAYEKALLHEVAELDALPVGAYNIRANGASAARNTTAHIDIVIKTDKPGIDIYIGFQYFNTDTHKMITWDGNKWFNPDGTEAKE